MNTSHSCSNSLFTADVDELLHSLTQDGFTWRYCNGPRQPTLIVGTYDWGAFVDLAVLRDADDVISARVPTAHITDVFAPEVIVWLYASGAPHALRALLELPHPEHPAAPDHPSPAPRALHIPQARHSPVTVRPPIKSANRTRHARLVLQPDFGDRGW